MTFFKKNIVKERAFTLFDVYVAEMTSINPAFKAPITKQNLYGLFFELLYCLDPLSIGERASYRKIARSVRYRQRHPSKLDVRKREYVEKYLVETLVEMPSNINLTAEGRALAFSNIMERYSPYHGLHGILTAESTKRSKPDFEPLHIEDLRRGTMYLGSIHEYIATAITLNRKAMNSGSVWILESGDALEIKTKVMEMCDVPEDKILVHTHKSVTEEGSFQFTFSCLDEQIVRLVMKQFPQGELQNQLLTYCRLLRLLGHELSDFFIGYWLSADWAKVVETLRVALKSGMLSDHALEVLTEVIGEGLVEFDGDAPARPKHWDCLHNLLQPYLEILSSKACSKHSTTSVNESPDGVHHIFVGETLAKIAAFSFADLKMASFDGSLDEYYESRSERSHVPLFIEFDRFSIEGFLVMPAASRGVSMLCPNVFVHPDFLELDEGIEEFASLRANCLTKVTSFNESLTTYDAYMRRIGMGGRGCFKLKSNTVNGGAILVSHTEFVLLV